MSNPESFRELCRKEIHTGPTSGVLPGYIQANLLILPKYVAESFEDLCTRNPVACPILSKTEGGPQFLKNHASLIKQGTFDVRTDFPRYNVYSRGKLVQQKNNCVNEWSSDHVGFLIGCSFTFEHALEKAGLVPKNVLYNKNVSMFRTTKFLDSAGIFHQCPYVVSMRPYKLTEVELVREITRKFKKTHGEPIDWGYDGAKRLGIEDLQKPDYGDPIDIGEQEIPMFWACGVTPQLAVTTVGDRIEGSVIGHTPGHMLILDATDVDWC